MGSSSSKIEKNNALCLCKERNRFIKQAIDSRYALASAHLSYVESLRSIGIALRRFAEAEILAESSLSTSATDLDKTPSHSSYPSPSPPHNAGTIDSPLNNESPFSPRLSTMSYMRSGGTAALTVRLDPSFNPFVDDKGLTFPPPPPPPPESGSSWDFFDPTDSIENLRFHGENGYNPNLGNFMGFRQFRDEEEIVTFMEGEGEKWGKVGSRANDENFVGLMSNGNKSSRRLMMANGYSFSGDTSDRFLDAELVLVGDGKSLDPDHVVNGSVETLSQNASLEQSNSKREKAGKEKELCAEREDASEFITHRAKDFLSSIKDIEHRFFRTSEAGKDVLKMLEANKIQFSYSDRGSLPTSVVLAAFHLVCCRRETAPVPHETPQHVAKVITWNRSTSSQSSSSKNPFAPASKDDIDDSGSDFVEEFCMIAGSHSSTLDRLYAWERKLYDEVKASESIRKEYDRKCNQLRHQFAKDLNPRVIDKTRAVVKDLHSQIRVALHAVDSISKRIEKLRDEELQPQLAELIQGLIRMWKTMLECHHAQYITISLAYHARSSTTAPESETHKLAIANLQHEMDIFGSSFANWIDSHRSYVEALHSWLHNCILQPRERFRGRKTPFSPRRAIAPPIFVLCRDWLAGIQALPYGEVSDSIKSFLKDLDGSFGPEAVDQLKKQNSMTSESKVDDRDSKLSTLQASLTRVFDRLTKFSEASLKMYEDIRQSSEAARIAYTSDRIRF